MKLTVFVICLFLLACKQQAVNQVDPSVDRMWQDYTEAYPKAKSILLPDSWFFHNNRKDANRLAALTKNGRKQAGSGLYIWYEEAKADLPKIGTKHIVTDFDGKAQAIIEIVKVDTIPFNMVSEEYAQMDMGSKKDALEKWRKAHWEFFANSILESGMKPSEDMLVVCESFKTIWPNELK